jgi:hypothetical protein
MKSCMSLPFGARSAGSPPATDYRFGGSRIIINSDDDGHSAGAVRADSVATEHRGAAQHPLTSCSPREARLREDRADARAVFSLMSSSSELPRASCQTRDAT